jgi:hypothetical protein
MALARVARRYAESGLCAPRVAEALWRECAEAARAATRGGTEGGVWTYLATAHLALNEPERALSAAESAIAVSPADVAAHQLRLQALFTLGRFEGLAVHAARLGELAEPGSEAAAQAAFWRAHAR